MARSEGSCRPVHQAKLLFTVRSLSVIFTADVHDLTFYNTISKVDMRISDNQDTWMN